MKPYVFCVFATVMLTSANGGEGEWTEEPEELQKLLECFHCELGFWDTCYTTNTTCSPGEKCYTGRGKAADLLDVKLLGCVKEEECGKETVVKFLHDTAVFVMTKHCCDKPFCNAAHTLPVGTLLRLILSVLSLCLF